MVEHKCAYCGDEENLKGNEIKINGVWIEELICVGCYDELYGDGVL